MTAQPMCHHLLIKWTFLWSLLSMVKGSSMLVAPTSPSLEAGTQFIHLPGATVSAGVPEEMPTTTQKTHIPIFLPNVFQVLGKFIYYCPGLPSSEAP